MITHQVSEKNHYTQESAILSGNQHSYYVSMVTLLHSALYFRPPKFGNVVAYLSLITTEFTTAVSRACKNRRLEKLCSSVNLKLVGIIEPY